VNENDSNLVSAQYKADEPVRKLTEKFIASRNAPEKPQTPETAQNLLTVVQNKANDETAKRRALKELERFRGVAAVDEFFEVYEREQRTAERMAQIEQLKARGLVKRVQ
jgi:hypothetical protein